MHISDSQVSANILTKCSKMSEVHRLHGICENGDKSFKEEFPRTSCGQGARLKFFKDGKFILELERTLEGERVSWVSVHQKTYFPPQSTASLVTPYQPDSTTSLSDDNSSVQSSPWQRDHMWKQNCPSRNISSELNFYYWKPKGMRFSKKSKKRRTPFSTSSDFESNYVTLESFAKIKKSEKLSLIVIIQALIDKKIQTSKQSRAEIVVSPRKRILREIEKDKLVVSDNCQKRSRGKFQSANSSFTSVGKSTITNGIEDNKLPVTRNSGYSITSLLTEDHVSKKTPNNSPNHNSPLSQPIYRSPVSEDRWYSESVDRLRSIEINHAEKCSVSPSYNPHQSFTGPYVYPFQPLRSYYGPRLYEREYMLPSIYIGSPMSLGVRSEAPSCSCSFEEDWERNKECEEYHPPITSVAVPQVYNGRPAKPKEFPHMAAIGYGEETDKKWACAGGLISENFVITAAHCMSSRDLGDAKYIRIGANNILNVSSNDVDPQDFTIKRFIQYHEYRQPLKYHDIALIEINRPIKKTKYVNIACLDTERTHVSETLWIAGWGQTEFAGSDSGNLLKANVTVVDNQKCTSFYQDEDKLPNGILDDSMICAGGKSDTCNGDSGGPLMEINTKFDDTANLRVYNIIGITSFGRVCGIGGSPGIYTRVYNYLAWIENIVWPNES